MDTTVEPNILKEWLEEFEAAAKRPLEQRVRYAFIRTYKPVLDDAPFRAFNLRMISSISHTGKPSTSIRRFHASSNSSMPSGAKIKSRSKGPFFSCTKSFPRRSS